MYKTKNYIEGKYFKRIDQPHGWYSQQTTDPKNFEDFFDKASEALERTDAIYNWGDRINKFIKYITTHSGLLKKLLIMILKILLPLTGVCSVYVLIHAGFHI